MNKQEDNDDLDWIRDIMGDNTVTQYNYYEGARIIIKNDSEYEWQSNIPGVIVQHYSDYMDGNDCVSVKFDGQRVATRVYRIGPTVYDLDFYFGSTIKESEEDDGLDWIREIKPNPFLSYYDDGYNEVAVVVEDVDEFKTTIDRLYDLDYVWCAGSNRYTIMDDFPFLIFCTKNKQLLHASMDYWDDLNSDEIVIKNPFTS